MDFSTLNTEEAEHLYNLMRNTVCENKSNKPSFLNSMIYQQPTCPIEQQELCDFMDEYTSDLCDMFNNYSYEHLVNTIEQNQLTGNETRCDIFKNVCTNYPEFKTCQHVDEYCDILNAYQPIPNTTFGHD